MMQKYAIVTGASTGIGQAISIALAKNSYHVYLLGRNSETLAQTKESISDTLGSSEIAVVDLSDKESLNRFTAQIKTSSINIDAVVNAAAIWHGDSEVYAGKDFEAFSEQVISDTLAVGITAPMLLVHAVLPFMSSGASIVNISGTFEDGGAGWLPYYVSKRALEDFTVGLADELKEKEIRVNCISPSDTATEAYSKYFPEYLGDAIDPEEIASKVVELCIDDLQVTGEVIVMKKDTAPFSGFHV